ncbi:hypothetical protein CLOM_g22773 [Closterium sp. NIES-68]|nr:hypothetical protein CLOM_g22773 [Closterium sp. NIES-68]GJP76508.1 hypothetical protein CLOP_g6940 [Closterium sp. NIES-67]
MDEATELQAVLQALAVAVDWRTDQASRGAATEFLEKLKAEEEPHRQASIAAHLVNSDQPEHARLFGFQLLQNVARSKWQQFPADERRRLAVYAFDLLRRCADTAGEPWSIRSKAAALMADIVKHEGSDLWKEMLPSLLSLSAASPIHAETVALVLQFVPEDVTVHNEDIEGNRRRQLLLGLTTTLPQILPFLYSLLDSNFAAALADMQQSKVDAARQHAAAVTAGLAALGAYAEWAPVPALASAGLLNACGFLLGSPDFRMGAADFFKHLAARRAPSDDQEAFNAAMTSVADSLVSAADASLDRITASAGAAPAGGAGGEAGGAGAGGGGGGAGEVDEGELQFAERVCEAMVAFAPSNLKRAAQQDDSRYARFFHAMLRFFECKFFPLHALALQLWLVLLRESAQSTSGAKDKRAAVILVPPDFCLRLLDVVADHLPRRPGEGEGEGDDDAWQEEFTNSGDYAQYRSRLMEVIRLVTQQQPLIAASKVASRIEAAVGATSAPPSPKAMAVLEGARMLEDAVMAAVPDAVMAAAAAHSTNPAILADDLGLIVEGVLQRLLCVQWSDPVLIELHSHLLDALGPFLKHSPPAAALVMPKLFELLGALPPTPLGVEPMLRPERSEDRLPRLQVCTSILRVARSADVALVPMLKAMVDQVMAIRQQQQAAVQRVQQNQPGAVLHGEIILLAEALLLVAAAAGPSEEAAVVEWLLAPIRAQWTDATWQNRYLSSPAALAALLLHTPGSGSQEEADCWTVYHTTMLLERIMRRAAAGGGSAGGGGGGGTGGGGGVVAAATPPPSPGTGKADGAGEGGTGGGVSHCVSPHLHWIVPPMLRLLHCIHSLWSPQVLASLPPALAPALLVGQQEKAAVLGQAGAAGKQEGVPLLVGGSGGGWGEGGGGMGGGGGEKQREAAALAIRRNWLKCVRDNCYGFLGMAAANAPAAFFSLPEPAVPNLKSLGSVTPQQQQFVLEVRAALADSVASMEARHLRLLQKLVLLPLVKACPPNLWPLWLGTLLPPILIHCDQWLTATWQRFLQEGLAGVGEAGGGAGGKADGSSGGNVGGERERERRGALKDELFQEKILRDLTRETCSLLALFPVLPQSSSLQAASIQATASALIMAGVTGSSVAAAGGAGAAGDERMDVHSVSSAANSLLHFLLQQHPEAAAACIRVAMAAMDWPDSDASHKAVLFNSGLVHMPELLAEPTAQPSEPAAQLREMVGRTMFAAAVQALTLESNAGIQAHIVALLRDIYLRLGPLTSAPREVLLSLSIPPEGLASFEAALKSTGSAKEQRAAFRTLLTGVAGNQLKAFAAQRNPTTISNVSGVIRTASNPSATTTSSSIDQSGPSIGLASFGNMPSNQ